MKPNMFQGKHGVLKYYIPRMIVCQENVDYEKHLKIPFGTYMLANKDPKPTNTNASSILDYIHLQDTYSLQVGH